jgi:hypothetical protein
MVLVVLDGPSANSTTSDPTSDDEETAEVQRFAGSGVLLSFLRPRPLRTEVVAKFRSAMAS